MREEVLRRRGWEIHRVWSTDWFKNRQAEIDRLWDKLNSLAEKDKHAVQYAKRQPETPLTAPLFTEKRRLSNAEVEKKIKTYCELTIKRSIELQQKDGFMNEELLRYLLAHRPINRSDFIAYVPVDIRANLDPSDAEHLDNILAVLEEAI